MANITDLVCMNCGHVGYNEHEIKDGLCPECYANELYYCAACLAMFEDECVCDEDE